MDINYTKFEKAIITLEDASRVEVLNTNELKSMSEISKVYQKMPSLVAQKDAFDAELSKLNLEYVDVLDAKISKEQTKIVPKIMIMTLPFRNGK